MPTMSNHLESGLLYHLFRGTYYSMPSGVHVALCSGTVVETDTGGLVTKELGGGNPGGAALGGYSRQVIPSGNSYWNPIDQALSSSGHIDNINNITFGPATQDWGTISYIALCDSSGYGNGNVLMYGRLATPQTVSNGNLFQISAGNLDIYFD